VTAGLPAKQLKRTLIMHKVKPKDGSTVLLRAGDLPLLVTGSYERGRVLCLAAAPYCYYNIRDSFFHGDFYDDLIRQAAMWVTGRQSPGWIVSFVPPRSSLHPGDKAGMSLTVVGEQGMRVRLQVSRDDEAVHESTRAVQPEANEPIELSYDIGPRFTAKGRYEYEVALLCRDGSVAAARDGAFQVRPPLRVEPGIEHHKDVTAFGYNLDFTTETRNETPADIGVKLQATILDAAAREIHRFAEKTFTVQARKSVSNPFRYTVPRLANGEYRFVAVLTHDDRIVDRASQVFHVVQRIDRENFFQILFYLHMGTWPPIVDWDHMQRHIDDALAHGYTCIGSNSLGTWKPSYWVRLRNRSESYAQRKGMAVSYAYNSLVKMSSRKTPAICPNSPDYLPDIEKYLTPRLEEHMKMPRLHDSMTKDELAITPGFLCRCEHCQRRFRERYGSDLPEKMPGVDDPLLRANFVEFYDDFWGRAWQITREFMKKRNPDFMLSNTFTSSICGSRRADVVFGDLFKWAVHYDYIFGDVYPYARIDKPGVTEDLFRDFRCALAFLRCTAQHYDIPHAYWIENTVPHTGAPARAIRRNAYTAVGQGAKGLLGWGAHFPESRLPQDYPELWEDMGRTFHDIGKLGPLLLKSRKRSRVALVYSATDWLSTQTYSGPYTRLVWSYDMLGRTFGSADILYERQIRGTEFAGHSAVVLTDVECFSTAAAQSLAEFVKKGGVVLCDTLPTRNEKGEPLTVLEELFGVKPVPAESAIKTLKTNRALPPCAAQATMQVVVGNVAYQRGADVEVLATFPDDDSPALTVRAAGKGRAYMCGFSLTSTYQHAIERELPERVAALSRLVRGTLAECGVYPLAYSSLPDVEANFLDGKGSCAIVAFNHSTTRRKPVITVHHPGFEPGYVVDLLRCRDMPFDLDAGSRTLVLEPEMDGLSERLIGLYPGKPAVVGLRAGAATVPPGGDVALSVEIRDADGRRLPALFVVEAEVTDPSGAARPEYGGRWGVSKGCLTRTLPIAINDPKGSWQVSVNEWLTKHRSTVTFEVR